MSQDVEAVCLQACTAFDHLSHQSPETRAAILDAIAAALDGRRDDILSTSADETALPIDELTPEFARMTGTLRMFAALLREGSWVRASIDTSVIQSPRGHAGGAGAARALSPHDPIHPGVTAGALNALPIGPNHDIRKLLIPLGPVAVFGSSNFPLAYGVCGGDTASALAAGCPVIVKEHPAHPKTGRLVTSIGQDAIRLALDEPEASARENSTLLLQYIHNEDPKDFAIAQQLVQHPHIGAVGFTGSIPGGLAIEKLARERETPIPVFAEMGSMNIAVILPSAMQRDPHALAMTLADSVLARCGQQCTKPGAILYGNGPGAAAFVAHLQDRFRTAPRRRLLAPWIAEAYHKKIMSSGLLGASIVAMADRAEPSTSGLSHAVLTETFAKRWFESAKLREENFGPTITLVSLQDFSALKQLPETGSLAMSVWLDPDEPRDAEIAADLLRRHARSAGRIIFNGVPTGVRVATSMVHGGPFPATNAPHTTAVGPLAIERWCRPICYQNCPDAMLPPELQQANPRQIWRTVNGVVEIPAKRVMAENIKRLHEQIRSEFPGCKSVIELFPSGAVLLDIPIGQETWVLEFLPSFGLGVSRISTATFGWEGFEHPFDDFPSAEAFVRGLLK